MGGLVVLEGIDGSGKTTQLARLCRRLQQENVPFLKISFPQYDKPSSALIRMYLGGEFGENPRTSIRTQRRRFSRWTASPRTRRSGGTTISAAA